MSEIPLKLLQPISAGAQTDPLTFILLELLVRDAADSRLCVAQVLHFLSFLTQPDRCSCLPLLEGDSLLGFAVPLAGALVSSSKASQLVMWHYRSEREAVVKLLLETAKHTLQLATAIVQHGKRDGEASAANVASSAAALVGTVISTASSSGLQPAITGQQAGQHQLLGSASLASGREQGVGALVWGACHLIVSAARVMLHKADIASGVKPPADANAQQLQDVEAVQQLLQDLQYSSRKGSTRSTSSSSSRSKHQAGSTKGSRAGLGAAIHSATSINTEGSCTQQEQCRTSGSNAGPSASLERVARRSMARVIQSCCCNNLECVSLEGVSELGMVLGGVCGGCRSVAYCSRGCQELDWKEHRKTCMRMRNESKCRN